MEASKTTENDARRINACLNALKGVPTEEVERWAEQQFQISTKAHYDGLVSSRDELLEALEGLDLDENFPECVVCLSNEFDDALALVHAENCPIGKVVAAIGNARSTREEPVHG